MDAVGYIRVSTDGQARDGVSVEAQEAKIRAWCEMNSYRLAGVYIETMSGGRADNRPKLRTALSQVCTAKGVLVVYSLSRLARSTTDAIEISRRLEKCGADLASLTERIDTTSAAGKMVFRMLAVLAEFERDQIRERTTAAMAHMRRKGLRISGSIPFGYDLAPDRKTLLPNPTERGAIALIAKLRGSGHSFRQIAAKLQAKGIPAKRGGAWEASAVKSVLDRAAKLGPFQSAA